MAESTGLKLLNAEDNDLSHLTITSEGSNTFTIETGAANNGTYGYRTTYSGNAGENLNWAYETFTSGSDIYCRCYFRLDASFSMSASQYRVLGLRSGATECIYARMIISGGNISFDRVYYQISTGQTFGSFSYAVSKNVWHYLELRYKSDASAGIVEAWFDDATTAKLTVTGLNTGGYNPDRVLIGNILGAVPTAGSYTDIDDVKVDSSKIGLYADQSSGKPYYYQMQQ